MRKILLIATAAFIAVGCSDSFKVDSNLKPKKLSTTTGSITGGTVGGTSGGVTGGTTGGTSGGTTGATTGSTTSGTTTGGTSGGTTGPTPGPQSPPACENGKMVNMKDYFFYLINRAEGSWADDWREVLGNSPLGHNPAVGEIRGDGSPHYGLTQQRNSAGEPRARLFLPTDSPDDYGYYIHGVDVVVDHGGGHFTWTWNDWLSGIPPFAPRACY